MSNINIISNHPFKIVFSGLTRWFIILLLFSNAALAQSTVVVFSESFSGSSFPAGWKTVIDKPYEWKVVQGVTSIESDPYGSAMNFKKVTSKIESNVNIWAFSSAVYLTPGIAYTVNFSHSNLSSGSAELTLILNTKQEYIKPALTLANVTLQSKIGWHENYYTFSVSTGGYYYLGYGLTTINGDLNISFDEPMVRTKVKDFYNNTLSNLTSLNSWGSNPDGTGMQPVNFTDPALRFNIVNYKTGATCQLPKDLALTGAESRILIGNGSSTIFMPIVDGKSLTNGIIDLNDFATLSVNSAICPALGNLSIKSTVIFGKSAPAEIQAGLVFGTVILDSGKNNKFNKKVTIKGKLDLKDANLDLGDNDLELGFDAAVINASPARYIWLTGNGRLRQGVKAGGPEVILPVGNGSYNPAKIKLTRGSQDDVFSVGILNAVYSTYTNDVPDTKTALLGKNINRTWLISEDATGGSDIALTLSWNIAGALTGFDPLQCHIKHYENGAWDADISAKATVTDVLSGITTLTTYAVTRTGITSFSPFTVSAEGPTTLPVELLHFTAKATGNNTIKLNWATAMEKDNDFFSVERSADGSNFTAIARLNGVGTTNRITNYSFTDNNPLDGTSYYRLRQVDMDGSFDYLPMRAVTLKGTLGLVLHVYPNPAQGNGANLRVQGLGTGEEAQLLITEIMGRRVLQQPLQAGAVITTGGLQAGTYLVSVVSKAGVQTQKLIIK